jgi:hypothetical protein
MLKIPYVYIRQVGTNFEVGDKGARKVKLRHALNMSARDKIDTEIIPNSLCHEEHYNYSAMDEDFAKRHGDETKWKVFSQDPPIPVENPGAGNVTTTKTVGGKKGE